MDRHRSDRTTPTRPFGERLLMVGLNHSTAPLSVRERVAFGTDQLDKALEVFGDYFPGAEGVILSTCNRVELYVARTAGGHPDRSELVEFIARFHGLEPDVFEHGLYTKEGLEATRHLFNVAASLDSMVLGETQILGQVRDAYERSRRLEKTGQYLNPLFQRAVSVARQAMTQSSIGEGRMSVASVAVEQARRLFPDLDRKIVLSIGAGKIGALVLSHFADQRPGRLLVCNRDAEKGRELAGRWGATQVDYDALDRALVEADIVLTGTGAATPILTRECVEEVQRQRDGRALFIIDIAVPRDVEVAAGAVQGVHLFNIDDLQQVVEQARADRHDAVDQAVRIVDRGVADYAAWRRQRELGPLIETVYERSHQIGERELARALHKLSGLDDAQRAVVQELSRRLVNKVFADPIRRLRRPDLAHLSQGASLEAIKQLFGLSDMDLGPSSDETIYRDNI